MPTDLLRDPSTLAALVALPAAGAAVGVWAARRWQRLRRRASPGHGLPSNAPGAGRSERERFLAMLAERAAAAGSASDALCLLSVGLDDFRLVNDRHGRAVGDQVLRAAAARVLGQCGASAPPARIEADEFAIALAAPHAAAQALAHRLIEAFAEPLAADAGPVAVGVSIGIAVAPEHGSGGQLLANAAAAMRAARRSGGGTYALFDPQIEAQQRDETIIARELRQAVARRELELVYQPKIDADSLQVTAVEALLRWRHPALGLVSPVRFIPIAERHGLIEPIGNWVLESALRQAAAWRKAGLRMRVAINVSGYQMRQDDFAVKLEKGLAQYGLQPGRFTCEITESVAMEDTAVTRRAFTRLAKIGVHVSIDDFGTGHSSLATLRRLPAQELKIDRSFVTGIEASEPARTIVRAVVQMAHALNLKVVAEGVENEAQRDLLVRLGCNELQGHLFARPMSARAIAIWASDAPATLAQSFRPSLFKETRLDHAAPTELLHRATVLEPRGRSPARAG
ncbi:MAG: hypothetical protein AMXMBFR66_01550 [Pseudomonadota bacterium]